jgi:tetratricopeptide (TPR) repeat protein
MQIQIGILEFNLNLVRSKQYLEALDRYKQYLSSNPNHLAIILISLYKHLFKHPTDLNIRLIIVELYIRFSLFEDALVELEEMADINPNYSQTYYLISKLYKLNYKTEPLIKLLQSSFDNGVRDSIIIDLLPKIYIDQKKISKSIHVFETLLKENGALPHHNKALSELYRQVGKFEKSVEIYLNLIKEHPQYIQEACIHCEKVLTQQQNRKPIRVTLITMYQKNHAPEKAISHLEILSATHDFNTDILVNLYKELLSNYPNNQSLIKSFINSLIVRKKHIDALKHLDQLIELSSTDVNFFKNCIKTIKNQAPIFTGIGLFEIKLLMKLCNYEKCVEKINSMLLLSKEPSYLEELKKYSLTIWGQINNDLKLTISYCLAYTLFHLNKLIDSYNYCELCAPNDLNAMLIKLDILNKQENMTKLQQETSKAMNLFPQSSLIQKAKYKSFLNKVQNELTQTSLDNQNTILGLIQSNKVQEAIGEIQNVNLTDNHYSISQLLLSRCFMEENKFDQAIHLLENLIPYLQEKNDSYYVHALFFQSICFCFFGEHEKSYDNLKKIQSINISFPSSNAFLAYLSSFPFSVNRGLAVTGLINLWDKPITVTSFPNQEESHQINTKLSTLGFGTTHNDNAVKYIIKNNLVNALSELTLAQQLNPDLTIVYSNLALLHILNEHYEEAKNYIELAKQLNSKLDAIYINEGLMYYKQKKYKHAIESFQFSLKTNPNNLHAKYNLAILYFLFDNVQLCFKYLQELTTSGLFFINLDSNFRYLEIDFFNINNILSPREKNVFKKHIL